MILRFKLIGFRVSTINPSLWMTPQIMKYGFLNVNVNNANPHLFEEHIYFVPSYPNFRILMHVTSHHSQGLTGKPKIKKSIKTPSHDMRRMPSSRPERLASIWSHLSHKRAELYNNITTLMPTHPAAVGV